MSSTQITAPPKVAAAFDALDAAVAAIGELDFDNLDAGVRLRALERLETARRRQVVVSHDVIAGLAKEDPADIGGPVHKAIPDWLRIGCAESRRRISDAKQLAPRTTLTGGQLPPELPATATAWRAGVLDEQHLRVIQTFVRGPRSGWSWRRSGDARLAGRRDDRRRCAADPGQRFARPTACTAALPPASTRSLDSLHSARGQFAVC